MKKTDAISISEILKENLDYNPDLLGGNSVNPTTLRAGSTDKKHVSLLYSLSKDTPAKGDTLVIWKQNKKQGFWMHFFFIG